MKQNFENNLYLIGIKRLLIDEENTFTLKNGYHLELNMVQKEEKIKKYFVLRIILLDKNGIAAYALEVSKKMHKPIMDMSILEKINYILEPNHLFGKKEYDKMYHSFIYDIPLPKLEIQHVLSEEANHILFNFKQTLLVNKPKKYKRKVR